MVDTGVLGSSVSGLLHARRLLEQLDLCAEAQGVQPGRPSRRKNLVSAPAAGRGCASGWGRCHELRPREGYTMARYVISDSYAATVLPIIREIHREILARKPPAGAAACFAACRAARCASRLVAESFAFASTGSAGVPSRAMR